jgi:hypothetical protein
MAFECKVGETLLLPKPSSQTRHLWVVATPQCEEPPRVVIVNITSLRIGSDETIILDKGDHPFIDHPSVVYYTDAQIVTVKSLLDIYSIYGSKDQFAENVMSRIQEGFFNSPFARPRVVAFCKKALNKT